MYASEASQMYIDKLRQPVATFETYQKHTMIMSLLANSVSEPTVTEAQVTSFLSQLETNASTKSLKELRRICDSMRILGTPDPASDLQKILLSGQDNISQQLIDTYQGKSLKPIGLSADDKQIELHLRGVLEACAFNFYLVQQQLHRKYKHSTTSYMAVFRETSITEVALNTTNLTEKIMKKITINPDVDFVDDYLNRCYKLVHSDAVNDVLLHNVKRELYFLSFLPYYVTRYIASFIPLSDVTSQNKAPRNGVVRRVAIQCLYEAQLFMLYSYYQLNAMSHPSSSQTYRLRLIIDTFMNYMFQEESEFIQNTQELMQLHSQTKTTFDSSFQLAELSQRIDVARRNISSLKQNEYRLTPQVRQSVLWMWVWLVILCMYLVLTLVSLLLVKQIRVISSTLAFTGAALLITLCIMGVIKLSRSLRGL